MTPSSNRCAGRPYVVVWKAGLLIRVSSADRDHVIFYFDCMTSSDSFYLYLYNTDRLEPAQKLERTARAQALQLLHDIANGLVEVGCNRLLSRVG